MAASNVLTVQRAEHVATVWLDRPEKLNAMGPAFWDDLPATMEELSTDRDVRAIVVAARGDAFSVGIDLKAYGPAMASGFADGGGVAARLAGLDQVKRMQHTFTSVADCAQPVIAAVHGYCLGAGLDLITACDIRLASEDATFSVRETRIGMVADVGTLQRLPRIIDPGKVAELVYTGRDVSAAEARQIGLVNHVYPDPEALWKAADTLAAEIAVNSPLAVRGAKAVLRANEGRTVQEGLDYVALWNAAFLHSDDLAEAMQAFMEKREPRFEGK